MSGAKKEGKVVNKYYEEIRLRIETSPITTYVDALPPQLDEELIDIIKISLVKAFRSRNWSEELQGAIIEEIVSLERLAKKYSRYQLIDQTIVGELFRGRGFNVPPFNTSVLDLLEFTMTRYKYSFHRDHTGDLRRGVVQWISRFPIQLKFDNDETAEEIHFARYESNINYLREIIEYWQTEENSYAEKAFQWIIQVYLESICLERHSATTLSYLSFPYPDNSFFLSIMQNVCKLAAEQVRPSEAIELLFPEGSLLSVKEQIRLSKWHRTTIRVLIYQIINQLNAASSSRTQITVGPKGGFSGGDRSEKQQSLSFLEVFSMDPSKLDIISFLRFEPVVWFTFVEYFFIHQLVLEYFKEEEVKYKNEKDEEKKKQIQLLEAIPKYILVSFTNISSMISYYLNTCQEPVLTQSISIEFLSLVCNLTNDCFIRATNTLNLDIYTFITEQFEKSNQYKTKIEKILTFSKEFMPKDAVNNSMSKLKEQWTQLTLKQLESYLHIQVDTEAVQELKRLGAPQLPLLLIKSFDWLYVMAKSELFQYLWNEHAPNGTGKVMTILLVSKSISEMRKSIDTQEINFSRLSQISKILLKGKERAALEIGSRGVITEQGKPQGEGTTSSSPGGIQWMVFTDINKDWCSDIGTFIKQWRHLEAVYSTLPSIIRVLYKLDIFINPAGISTLEHVIRCTNQLIKAFEIEKFYELKLKDYARYHEAVQAIDPCFTRLNAELFEIIPKTQELLDWLRTIPSDNEFTSNIEFSMGKTEMECPSDLWEAEPGKPGRVSEEKLSMLSTVRRYLHDLIYRTELQADDLFAFLPILRDLRATDDNIIRSLLVSNQYRIPLMELLDDNRGQSAPDRLLSLLLPSKRAVWCCSSQFDRSLVDDKNKKVQEDVGQLWLEWYVVSAGTNKEEVKRQNINELMDFQSTVVLAATDKRTRETQLAIDNFIQQFGWMKLLLEFSVNLHNAGHFDYKEFDYQFSINSDSNDIRLKAIETQKLLEYWQEEVSKVREEYYYFNYFTLKQLWKLVDALNGKYEEEEKRRELKQLIKQVNYEAASNYEEFEEFMNYLENNWKEGAKNLTHASDILRFTCKILHDSLLPLRVITRGSEIEEESKKNYKITINDDSEILNGIHLVCTEDSGHVYDCILSIYASAGYFPDRGEVYICRSSTTWEEINNLLLRWSSAHSYQRSNKVYCLAAIEYLSFELQRKTALALRDFSTKSQNPFIIISGQIENQHLVTQFSHCRTNFNNLTLEIIREFTNQLANQYSQGILMYTGYHAGSGKTFQIRQKANSTHSEYVHIPVLVVNDSLIQQVKTAVSKYHEDDYVLLHFDVADNIKDDFNSYLFDLTVLGGLYSSKGDHFIWNPETTIIAVELPTPSYNKIRVSNLLPQHFCKVASSTFCSAEYELKTGMDEAFHSASNDGTAVRKKKAILKANQSISQSLSTKPLKTATAYERLQYVCTALQIMDTNNGRFPYVDENLSVGGSILASLHQSTRASGMFLLAENRNELPGTTCFKLLKKALAIEKGNTLSLWCLWNFINVFYWQLRDMHHPESPINCACMPDKNSMRQDDTDGKAKIKGEVVRFLINTAKEFAIRQQRKFDPSMTFGLRVTGFSRWEFNGVWTRLEFDNDGKPCFKKPAGNATFYFYYRSNSNNWVIDDIMEATGVTFSRSESDNINSTWYTCSDWEVNPSVHFAKGKVHKDAHGGNTIQVSGFKLKANCVEDENGLYLQQPPYDNIAGKPHYIKTEKDYRRHLFWSEAEGLWQICPVCSNEEGAFGLSATTDIFGKWRTIPPDKTESKSHFEFLDYHQWATSCGIPMEKRQKATAVSSNSASAVSSGKGKKDKEEEDEEIDEISNELIFMEELWDNTVKWNDSNHECLLFSNEQHVVRFLSLDPKKMREKMHPGLLSHLTQNKINVGEDLHELGADFHKILSSLTGVNRTSEQGKKLLGGKYCLTGDSLLKMLAIFVRIRCGVPVVLMGECGCGKTMLIKYLCAWMGVKLIILDVHGGTTVDDILNTFQRAEDYLAQSNENVFVFLDEINTCGHMGLMNEAICHRSVYGKRISDGIQILAALNPYRRRPDRGSSPGLVYQLHNGQNATPDPMAKLVYRVHPIPHTLRDFIFDFGALNFDKEFLYISSMVDSKFPQEDAAVRRLVSEIIVESQKYIRIIEQDESSTSLRDVTRCLELIQWFSEKVSQKSASKPDPNAKPAPISPFACSVVLALAFVYYYRLGKAQDRANYWSAIGTSSFTVMWSVRALRGKGFEGLKKDGAFEKLLQSVQNKFCQNVQVEDGIAMNQALMENLFVTIICILNKIPVFLIGKPGSSKTLTMQVITSNLQGKQSEIAFWRKFPAIYTFQYQCSPMSDSHSIQHQFDMAVRYQQHAENTITVLLLDEVGLAEHSPDMPLKVLHAMLVDPPIAVVGLSNWVLDPAKMNRAICLQRTEPSKDDIQLTGKRILTSVSVDDKQAISAKAIENLENLLSPLAQAYHTIYTKQQGRDFVGMRDYYNLIKLLRSQLSLHEGATISDKLLTFALCRNFGGKPKLMDEILQVFHKSCFNTEYNQIYTPTVPQLIAANLNDNHARHLMVLTKNSAALPLLFGCDLIDERSTTVLVGSEFKDDKTELHLVTQINQVKLAMASGSTIILLNHDNIYEALYDVLNQRYLYKKDTTTGQVIKLLRLAIGSRSQLCLVKDTFKIIVIVEQDHAYRNLDLPLLNRFEKQLLTHTDILTHTQKRCCQILNEWVLEILAESQLKSSQHLFCSFHAGTIPSIVFNETRGIAEFSNDEVVATIKKKIVLTALPTAIMSSSLIREQLHENQYFDHHGSFKNALEHYVIDKYEKVSSSEKGKSQTMVFLTYSPALHLDIVLKNKKSSLYQQFNVLNLQLAEITSERLLLSHISNYLTVKKRVQANNQSDDGKSELLIIQCDPIVCKQSLIDHARQVIIQQLNRFHYGNKEKGIELDKNYHVLFVIHLPQGIKMRKRQFSLDFYSTWEYVFIDDLRESNDEELSSNTAESLTTLTLLNHSVYELIQSGRVSLATIIEKRFQYALSYCTVPKIENIIQYYSSRIHHYRELLRSQKFTNLVESCVLNLLKSISAQPEDHVKGRQFMHKHVELVCKQLAGSFRQSLQQAIQTFIIQALTIVIRRLDVDFNIDLINDKTEKLWYRLAAEKTIFNEESLFYNSLQSEFGNSYIIPSDIIPNNGLYGPLVSKFPFSARVIPLIHDKEIRNKVQTSSNQQPSTTIMIEQLNQIIISLFNEELNQLWNEWANNYHINYLYDFLSTKTSPIPGIEFITRLKITEKLLLVYRNDSLSTIGGIHVTLWMIEKYLYHLCSILSISILPAAIKDQLIQFIFQYEIEQLAADSTAEQKDAFYSEKQCKLRIGKLIYSFIEILFNYLWENYLYSSFIESLSKVWLHKISSISNSIQCIFVEFQDVIESKQVEEIVNQWIGLLMCSIYQQEIVTFNSRQLTENSLIKIKNFIKLSKNNNRKSLNYFKSLVSLLEFDKNDIQIKYDSELAKLPFSLDEIYREKEQIQLRINEMMENRKRIDKLKQEQLDGILAAQLQHSVNNQALPKGTANYNIKYAKAQEEREKQLAREREQLHDLECQLSMFDSQIQLKEELEEEYKKYMESISNFIRRYIQEILFGGQERYYNFGTFSQIKPDDDLVDYLETIVNAIQSSLSNQLNSLSLKKMIISCLLRAYGSGLISKQFTANNTEAQQCYLHYYEDHYSNNQFLLELSDVQNALLPQVEGKQGEGKEIIVNNHITSAEQWRNYLNSLAKCKLTIKYIAIMIIEEMNKNQGRKEVNISSIIQSNEVIKELINHSMDKEAKILLMKYLKYYGGIDIIGDLFDLPLEQTEKWLLHNRNLLTNSPISIPDIFSMLTSKATNEKVNSVIRNTITGSNNNLLDEIKSFPVAFLIPSLFSQLVCEYPSIHPTRVKALHQWIESNYRLSVDEACIIKWMTGGLQTEHIGRSSIKELCLLQLFTHLLFFTVQHKLTWITMIILNPENIYKNFLPSIPDSLLATMVQVSGNVGWYKCPNGHPYSVGGCTMPMEESICLHPGCGAKIGGRNHVCVAGVRRMTEAELAQLHKAGYLLLNAEDDCNRILPSNYSSSFSFFLFFPSSFPLLPSPIHLIIFSASLNFFYYFLFFFFNLYQQNFLEKKENNL